MAEYLPLLEIEIEEPESDTGIPQRLGFTQLAEDFTILDRSGGKPRHFGSGLVSMSAPGRQADFFDGGSSSQSANATLTLDAFPATELQRRGVRLQRLRCRMWWWPRGGTLADAVLLWRGEARDPAINLSRGTVSLSFKAATRERDVAFPPGFVGDDGRFPDAIAANRKQPMTVVYGRPLEVPLYAVTNDSGLFTVRLLVAGHRIPSQSINVRVDEATSLGVFTTGTDIDGRGGVYSYVDIGAGPWPGAGTAVYAASLVGWESPTGTIVEGLGDVLLHMVHTYGAERFFELDRNRCFGSRALLNRYLVAGFFNTPDPTTSLLQVLKRRFEGQFPVVFGFANGLFGWDYVGVPSRGGPVASLTWPQTAPDRGVLTQTSIDQVRARYEVQYRQLGFAAGNDSVYRMDETNNAAARAALTRWGVEAVQRLQAPDIADVAGAFRLAEDELRRRSDVYWRISYDGLPPEWLALPLFGRVHVTDPGPMIRRPGMGALIPALGWVAKPFLIEGLVPNKAGLVRVDLISEEGL